MLLHARQDFPGEVYRAHQELVDGNAPLFGLGIPKRVRRRTAGIGNTNVDPAEASFDGGDESGNCRGISDIERLVEDFAPGGFLKVCGGFGKGGGSAGADGDLRAFASELFCYGAAKPFAGGRDDSYASSESQIHSGTSPKTLILSRKAKCVNALRRIAIV
jgi:hypothetical protein